MVDESSKIEESNSCIFSEEDKLSELECPWFINSKKHHNCLWIYIRETSNPDGSMPELVQTEIAQLMGWSNTKTHFMLKTAISELVTALVKHKANQLLVQDPDKVADVNTYNLDINHCVPDEPED